MAVAMTSEAIRNAAHLSVDMQNIFDRGGIWETPWMERVLPNIVAIAESNPARTDSNSFHSAPSMGGPSWQMAALFQKMGMHNAIPTPRVRAGGCAQLGALRAAGNCRG